jgi:hypothetical protein
LNEAADALGDVLPRAVAVPPELHGFAILGNACSRPNLALCQSQSRTHVEPTSLRFAIEPGETVTQDVVIGKASAL